MNDKTMLSCKYCPRQTPVGTIGGKGWTLAKNAPLQYCCPDCQQKENRK